MLLKSQRNKFHWSKLIDSKKVERENRNFDRK